MVIQLHTPIGCYIPRLDREGYIHFFIDRGNEDYIYFVVMTDDGEWWTLSNREIRGTVNYTNDRPTINKEQKSLYLGKTKGLTDGSKND